LIRAARSAGVALVPGTGPGIPVSALYRELELFVEAGMTPAQALQAATSTAADLMKAGDTGTIEPGKRADLIVLTANPLENISNLRTARWVVANGRTYDTSKLWEAAGFDVPAR
jgi:imidazolonepropionase-like amidohydrolase